MKDIKTYTGKNRFTRKKKSVVLTRLILFVLIFLIMNLPQFYKDMEQKISWKTLNSPMLKILEWVGLSATLKHNLDGLAFTLTISLLNTLLIMFLLILLNRVRLWFKNFLHVQ